MNQSCPNCHSDDGIREIVYGLPDGPVDESKYVVGGCCVSDNDPSMRCIECGWEGEYKSNVPYQDKSIHTVELKNVSEISDAEIDEYAKRLWGKLTNEGKGWSDGNTKS